MLGRFSASLYVGMTTSARSATSAHPPPPCRRSSPDCEQQQRGDGDELAAGVVLRRERQLHLLRTCLDRNRQEGLVSPQGGDWLTVHRRVPVWIPVLGDQQVAVLGWWRVEHDRHAPRRPVGEGGPGWAWRGNLGDGQRIDRLCRVEQDQAAVV